MRARDFLSQDFLDLLVSLWNLSRHVHDEQDLAEMG
jgi:hypothetical protein